MRRPCALVALALVVPGCTNDRLTTRPASAVELSRAERVTRSYLDAAARHDRGRLCALRTDGVLSRWGGGAACERRAKGLLLGPYRRSTPRHLKLAQTRKGSRVDAAAAEIVPGDTSGSGQDAVVFVDFGKAFVENGRAIGGEILVVDLKRRHGGYRVSRVGFASFAD